MPILAGQGNILCMKQNTLFSLFKKRHFGPFFVTQFLGAFNDNVFKNAVMILISFTSLQWLGLSSGELINLCGGVFILPFFLFSATCGQLADKFDKSRIIRLSKLLEILLVVLAGIGFYGHFIGLLIVVLFLLGLQSTLFGPVKYSILPQHLPAEDLVSGNALVEMGTFIAILLGTICGGVLIALNHQRPFLLVICLFLIAVVGYGFSLHVPSAPANAPDLIIRWNPFTQTIKNIHKARQNRMIFLSILGISWFWFIGALFLAQIPNYTKLVLGGNAHVATLLLACLCIGIGVGSMLCEKLSRHRLEIGLVPLGSIGLSLFAFTTYYVTGPAHPNAYFSVREVLHSSHHIKVMISLLFFGIAGGFYTVPLYTLIQQYSEPRNRSRIIATNNILNALFMVLSALLGLFLIKWHFSIPQIFLTSAVLNIFIAVYLYGLLPEFLMRFMCWLLLSFLYRIHLHGVHHIPRQGGAVVVCNHISYIDALLLSACSPRPIRFVMDQTMFKNPLLNFIFKASNTIPIASEKDDPICKQHAFVQIANALKNGDLVGVFPEGKITSDGQLNPFRSGIEQLIQQTPAPVIPIAIQGLWGSFFSRKNGRAMSGWPRKLWTKITVTVAPPVPAEQVSSECLQHIVAALLTHDV